MKDIKKTLKLAGIITLVINILNISNLLLDIFYLEFSAYNVIVDSIAVALTFLTGITYLCLLKKNNEYLIKHRNLFLVITLLNIFNNIFVWIISLWVEIAVTNSARYTYFKNMHTNPTREDGSIEIEKDDYSVKRETDYLSESLEDLEKMKNKGEITEEEYNTLRQTLINKFLDRNK